MKPVFSKILDTRINDMYGIKVVDEPYFSTDFHFHEECQLVYLVESEGRVMIGDSIDDFGRDELIFIGSNLPHVWHNNNEYFNSDITGLRAKSASLFLHPDKILEIFKEPSSIQKLKQFFQRGKRGVKFGSETKKEVKVLLLKMVQVNDEFKRMMLLLEILNLICHCSDFQLLSSPGYANSFQLKDNDRIDKILRYVFDNFSNEISLDQAAELINMNKQAFCRYFKKRTQKTFVTFINEVRVGHACKLMKTNDLRVGELAYSCGFKSLTNFTKSFKSIKGITPKEYKKLLTDQ
ncbi:AraC family transcriptional regulator [Sphingobacterium spiritivorum]|uniref:AraC family transcriptional regulator n=1 Tax=Sphingobacterium spiritivorum TaxID=258 RepID=UPI00191B334E|nr:AraC family transcriptional regulator [Sphingobacterium spiritivorum]QQT25685.1 helix-turn-helix domain-containing protein [Sphingobacterium spiritivorum]